MSKDYHPVKRKSIAYIISKEILGQKKLRAILYILAILWVAVISDLIVQSFIVKKGSMIEAFVNTNSLLMESTLEITAPYRSDYLSQKEKESLIHYIASKLNVDSSSGISAYADKSRQELKFLKKANKATTEIKIITNYPKENKDQGESTKKIETSNYLLIRLTIFEDVSKDILAYESRLREAVAQLNISGENINSTLQFSGVFAGNLSLETKNKLADQMILSLGGEIVFENREEDLYTIYAYTGLLNNYIVVDGKKINIHVAMLYEEDIDRTKILLATPIISGNW